MMPSQGMVKIMGIIRTDLWLNKDFSRVDKICERLSNVFNGDNSNKIYQYLTQFGMYKPNTKTYEIFEKLKEERYWEKVESIFRKYHKEWNGPDIPIYIFPLAAANTIFSNSIHRKSGVAFKDKLFLFLSHLEDEKELEALFVHEYHHTCRITSQNLKAEEATLLDSMILEGLAEYAVQEYCGKKYIANWCEYYSEKEIIQLWEKFLKKEKKTKKMSKKHDDILYGRGKLPKMAGYSAGFVIVSMYRREKDFTWKQSFSLEADGFIPKILT